jgi:hypothetical protein
MEWLNTSDNISTPTNRKSELYIMYEINPRDWIISY